MQGLSAKQRRAARYLGLFMPQAECARRVSVNVRTLRRWLSDDPEFAAAVEAEKAASRDMRPEDVLADLLLSPNESIRLQAARELRRTVASPPDADAPRDREEEAALAGWDDE
jgi:hypothetical protein